MSDAPDLDEFRARCRAFLDRHATAEPPSSVEDPRGDRAMEMALGFQKELAKAGLAGLGYPTEFGGQGLESEYEDAWREVSGDYPRVTASLAITMGMCLPMLNEYGSAEQRARYQARIIGGETAWCQMFSEPAAGSDVASLQTRAVLDGDEWVINGQKVWTTLAHKCDYGILIARTDPDQPKHRGITMFIVDMNAPGVEIRPIIQIDGGTRFNEIFFTDVRVAKDHQVGPLNEGWRLATAMLMYERVAIGAGSKDGVLHERADKLMAEAKARGRESDATVRQGLMKMYSDEICQSLMAIRSRSEREAGKTPGPQGSLGKLAGARIAADYRNLSLAIVGADAAAWSGDDAWAKEALTTFSSGIAGGTNEIQRNIIGERVLGLPREPSVDKDQPFREVLQAR